MSEGNLHRLGSLARAKLPAFRRKVDYAREIIEEALARAQHPYIAFSAGKDSTVLLHLVRQAAPDTPAVWSDDEWNLPETLALVEITSNCHRIAARVRHAEFFTSWDTDNPQLPEGTIWIDTPNNDGIQTFARQQGYDCVFIGLRADENGRRRKFLRRYGPLHFAAKDNVWQCNPLAWWTVEDVWAYIYANNVPYNAAYDKMSAMGIPLEKQRIGPFAVDRALPVGQMAILKQGWPDLYNQFAARYPMAERYT